MINHKEQNAHNTTIIASPNSLGTNVPDVF
jgi:hypothetical protein